MTNLVLLPNAEGLVSRFLQEHPDVVAFLESHPAGGRGDRTYTAIPKDPVWPLLRVT